MEEALDYEDNIKSIKSEIIETNDEMETFKQETTEYDNDQV